MACVDINSHFTEKVKSDCEVLGLGKLADSVCPGERRVIDPWPFFLQQQCTSHIITRVSHQRHVNIAEVLHANLPIAFLIPQRASFERLPSSPSPPFLFLSLLLYISHPPPNTHTHSPSSPACFHHILLIFCWNLEVCQQCYTAAVCECGKRARVCVCVCV